MNDKTLSNECRAVMGEIKTIVRTCFMEDFVSAGRVDEGDLSKNIRTLVLLERLADLGCELVERLENVDKLMDKMDRILDKTEA